MTKDELIGRDVGECRGGCSVEKLSGTIKGRTDRDEECLGLGLDGHVEGSRRWRVRLMG